MANRPPRASERVGTSWGELKQATVLFADIVSSTEQIANLDPEEAMERLQPAILAMCAAVERFGGTVVRTLGDGIMAIFGVPRALEGHATLACEAALMMQSAFAKNVDRLAIRVGLHSGEVASDPRAADSAKGGGAHGLTIHLASRVVGVADSGGIVLTRACYSLIRPSFEARSLGLRTLKGISESVEIYALTGLRPAFATQHFHQSMLSPFRGRNREFETLQRAHQMTARGDTQVIGVSGAPGTGKSRLCYEFAQWCRSHTIPVFEVRAQLYGSATPLQAILELMRIFLFQMDASDDSATSRKKVAEHLAELGPPVQADVALLSDFLGIASPDAPQQTLNPRTRHTRLLVLLRDLTRHAGRTSSVILIEDMHWLDEASEEFLATMIDAVLGTQILCVFNYRPQYMSPWSGLEYFQEMELGELSATDTSALVRELISHRRELQDICHLIVQRSGGNPFFAEELVRSLAESGVLSGEPGGFAQRSQSSVESALPATVQALVGARIDRLVPEEKALLQTCAIVGKEIPLAVLERVASSLSAAELERRLESLCHAELLQPQPAVGGRRYAFRHPMIQEVAYGSQLKSRRNVIHSEVARAMESYFEDRGDETAALIAFHFAAAGSLLEAARYEGRAARWVGVTNSAQAIKHWRKVWDLLKQVARNAEADQLRTMAGGQIGVLGWREGLKFEDVKPVIDEAIDLAKGKDDRLVQLLMIVDGRMQVSSGGSADAFVACARNALDLTDIRDVGRTAMLNSLLSQALGWAGRIEEALQANAAAMEMAHEIDNADLEFLGFDISKWLPAMRSRLLLKLGRYAEAQQQLAEHMSGVALTNDPIVDTVGHLGCVELAMGMNDISSAERHVAALSDLAEKSQIPYLRVFGLAYRALVAVMKEDLHFAERNLTEALVLVRHSNVAMEFEPEILEFLADCHLRSGNTHEAIRFAEECIELAQRRSVRLAECRALITLSKARVTANWMEHSVSETKTLVERAENLISETGALMYSDVLRAVRGKLDAIPA